MDANIQMAVGKRFDTGKKWIDGSVIYRKLIDLGALPNAAGKNVAHGEALDLEKWVKISNFFAVDPGAPDVLKTLEDADPVITLTNTNVVITATANLSGYTQGYAEIEFCL